MSWAKQSVLLCVMVATECLEGCARPETLNERLAHCDYDQVDCVNDVILRDAGSNALIGGIIGAAVGTGIGVATKNPHIVFQALGAAAAGAAAGGLATYYLEHQEASAIQDIKARNRQLAIQVEVFRRRDEELERQSRLFYQNSVQSRELLRDYTAKNYKFISQTSEGIAALNGSLNDFKRAVTKAYGNIPPNIIEEIRIYESKNDLLLDALRNGRDRAARAEGMQKMRDDGIFNE